MESLWASLIAALLLLAAGGTVRAQFVVIGYTNCVAVTNFSQATMNQIAQTKWYFSEASVGDLIMEGITNLNLQNPGFYQLRALPSSNAPPVGTTNGLIYDDDRGHVNSQNYAGDWQWTVTNFQVALSNGWHYPAVNLSMNILSFLDIWYNNSTNGVADLLNGYVSSMTNLEAAYPQTAFVYVTMPITTLSYSYEIDTEPADDYWRDQFNDGLRAWCRTNNRVLFDIADMEAHDTNGNLITFNFNNTACEELWYVYNEGGDASGGEIGDGAHPTNPVAEQLMARGFYALAAALLARTTTTLSSSANPSIYGQSAIFTATVNALDGTPTGAVQFRTNGVNWGAPVNLTGNAATNVTTTNFAVGNIAVSAVYGANGNFLGSTGTLSQTVLQSAGAFQNISVSGGAATLTFVGLPNSGWLVRRSTNLAGEWVSLLATNVPPSGSFQWVDKFHDLGAVPAAAFYQLQLQ